MRSRQFHNDTGLTLIEIMLAAGIMTIALVLIMGGLVSVSTQSKVSEARATATNFATSVLESLRGRSITEILTFNNGGTEYALDANGKIMLTNIGPATLVVRAVVTVNGSTTVTELPVTAEKAEELAPTMPNPLEIQVEIKLDRGFGTGKEYKFQTTTLLSY
jgi:type II secretory pathway pseudopilin PulG